MGYTFECLRCRWVKTEVAPRAYCHPGVCESCRQSMVPPPPPMRIPLPASITPSIGSLLIVAVFIAGVAVGAKMAGGW